MKRFRLARILRQEAEKQHGFDPLAKAIWKANGEQEGFSIDRRKLRRIANDPEVKLSVKELIVLDHYLALKGEGLAEKPILEKTSVRESLEDRKDVCFVIGSRMNERDRVSDLRRWDCRAMSLLLHDLGKFTSGLQIGFEDAPRNTPYNMLGQEKWYNHVQQEHGPSVIAIGSPRACMATEVLLAKMFGVPRFTKANDSPHRLPFYFVWSDTETHYPSSFAKTPDGIARQNPRLAQEVKAGKAWAFQLGDNLLKVRRDWRNPSKMYGVIAAQRQYGGQVHLAVAGVSGPATVAAATMVKALFSEELPRANAPSEAASVLWACCEVTVTYDMRVQGDNREIDEPKLISGPCLWTAGRKPELR
jgi:hypothetical protein